MSAVAMVKVTTAKFFIVYSFYTFLIIPISYNIGSRSKRVIGRDGEGGKKTNLSLPKKKSKHFPVFSENCPDKNFLKEFVAKKVVPESVSEWNERVKIPVNFCIMKLGMCLSRKSCA